MDRKTATIEAREANVLILTLIGLERSERQRGAGRGLAVGRKCGTLHIVTETPW